MSSQHPHQRSRIDRPKSQHGKASHQPVCPRCRTLQGHHPKQSGFLVSVPPYSGFPPSCKHNSLCPFMGNDAHSEYRLCGVLHAQDVHGLAIKATSLQTRLIVDRPDIGYSRLTETVHHYPWRTLRVLLATHEHISDCAPHINSP